MNHAPESLTVKMMHLYEKIHFNYEMSKINHKFTSHSDIPFG